MTVAKKIGTKQLKIKNGTFEKWLWRKKSEPNSVGWKNAPYKNDCCQKNRSKTVENNGALKKKLRPKKTEPNSVG